MRRQMVVVAVASLWWAGAATSWAQTTTEIDPVTFNLPGTDLMNVNVRVTYAPENFNQTQQSLASGSIPSNLTVAYNTSTGAASVSGSGLGVGFVDQDPGQISLGTLNYSYADPPS